MWAQEKSQKAVYSQIFSAPRSSTYSFKGLVLHIIIKINFFGPFGMPFIRAIAAPVGYIPDRGRIYLQRGWNDQ